MKSKFIAILDQYCSWICAESEVKKTKSDHLMGLLNFMYMFYTKSDYSADTMYVFPPPFVDKSLLSDFLQYVLPFTQKMGANEVKSLESIQENKYLRSLYHPSASQTAKRKIIQNTLSSPCKIPRVEEF
ncbi:MAG: hypothetical protein EOP45_12185 [Sphingobacteriaceae bacterium]|nr:MAG: hypothetical protein EOP45_12185 [Sphingobacteriaceae bacterium]